MLFRPILPLTFCLVFSAVQLGNADDGLNPAPGVTIPTDDMGVRIFSKVPPPGVHPRVLMSPEDLDPWRKSVGLTNKGKEFFSKRYQSKVVDELAATDASVTGKDLCAKFQNLGGGNSNGGGNDVLYATLDVMYHPEDKDTSTKVCRAATTLARVVIARSTNDPRWGKKGVDSGLGEIDNRCGDSLALSYDYLFNDMTADERNTCRSAIALSVKDLKTWGMGMPPGRDCSNWVSYHSVLALMHWSIEGEEGYDEKDLNSFLAALQAWFDNCFYAGGGGNEDGYMSNTSLREGSMAMVGWARRGNNLFRMPAYRAYWPWIIQSMVPAATGFQGVPYACNSPVPYETMPTVSRWAMPGNPLVNYYLYRYKGKDYEGKKSWEYGPVTMLFASDWEDTAKLPLDPAKLGLPLTEYFPELGLMTVRSDWSDEALSLNFMCRQDAWQNRHEGADRGRFVLCGLGRQWIGGKWNNNIGSETDSLVNIDGKAELTKDEIGKVPNGNMIAHSDSPLFAIGCMDLKRCYDWTWDNSFKNPGAGWEPETTSPADLGWVWPSGALPKALYGADDPANPAYGFVGMNYWRKPSNPVQYAFRTCALARGPHPYVLVVDDIQKDGNPHNYASNLEISPDIDLVPATAQDGFLTSKDAAVTGRMYYRVLSPADVKITTEDYTLPGRSEKVVPHRRVVIATNTVSPNFKIVFIPLKAGENPPLIGIDAGKASIAWADQKDSVTFTTAPQKYTQVAVTRDGKSLFDGFPSVKIFPSAAMTASVTPPQPASNP